MVTPKKNAEHWQGKIAFKKGIPLSECVYSEPGEQKTDWETGWKTAEKEREIRAAGGERRRSFR